MYLIKTYYAATATDCNTFAEKQEVSSIIDLEKEKKRKRKKRMKCRCCGLAFLPRREKISFFGL
ncbi:MAG: hypothetical protein ACI90V_003760 [Bacillariaceae sp.]|jgi:hypothetical protein